MESFIKRDKGGKNPQEKTQKKRGLTTMEIRQDNSIKILLRLKGYDIGDIKEEGDKIILEIAINRRDKCPYCGSGRLYRYGKCKTREVLHTWDKAEKMEMFKMQTHL